MSIEDDLLRLEKRVLDEAAGGWLAALDDIRRLLAMKSPALREKLFALVAPDIDADALDGVATAFGIGLDDALRILRKGNPAMRPDLARIARQVDTVAATAIARAAVEGLSAKAAAALRTARLLAISGADDATMLAPLLANRSSTKAAIEWALNDASNAATEALADSTGLPVVWIAERNACVHCLRYSGEFRAAAASFPAGLTYADSSPFLTSLRRPPLHPHCRCRLEILNSLDYAAALRREADRSVLKGWSLESESMRIRIEAAENLVHSGVDAPASVIHYAEVAIENGAFPTRGPSAAA